MPSSSSENSTASELHGLVHEWVSLKTVKGWLSSHPEQQVRNGIQYTLAQLKSGATISNVGGYLRKMVQEEQIIDPKAVKRRKSKAQKAAKQQDLFSKEKRKAELQAEKEQLYRMEQGIIQEALQSDTTILNKIVRAAMDSSFSMYDATLSWEDN